MVFLAVLETAAFLFCTWKNKSAIITSNDEYSSIKP